MTGKSLRVLIGVNRQRGETKGYRYGRVRSTYTTPCA